MTRTYSGALPSPPSIRSSRTHLGRRDRVTSLAGGALAATAAVALPLRPFARAGLLAASGLLFQRGLTGHSLLRRAGRGGRLRRLPEPLEVSTTVTVERSRDEAYAAWRRFEEFPRFMAHLSEVRSDGTKTHWVAPLPGGRGQLEWDAVTVADEPGRRVAWRSVGGAAVDNAGEVRFTDAPGRRGTEVHATIRYRAPAGRLGRAAARLLDPGFEQMVKEDLRRFKHVLEAGERPSIDGQPVGGRR
jgi:uncharacterized membrane protein